ncbi:MAG TPA: hypothetical protein VGH23_17465 [Rhizomicrobium sp.]|jgi:hypothetical protein
MGARAGATPLHRVGPEHLAQFPRDRILAPCLWRQGGAYAQRGQPGGIVGLVEERRRDQLWDIGLQALGYGADTTMMH